jgi:hypothetical protein
MAQGFVGGPGYVFVGPTASLPFFNSAKTNIGGDLSLVGNMPGGKAFFLGTCEQHPVGRLQRGWEPLWNDIGGNQIPFDLSYQGEEGFIYLELT